MKLHRDRVSSKRRNRIFGSLEARLSKRTAPFQFESLEGRSLLTGNALLQNPANACDVNADGHVQPLDVLIVVNDINSHGIRAVTLASDGPKLQAMAMTAGSATTAADVKRFVDVNGDNVVSPLDVLLVANALVEPDDLARIRLVATDLAGNPITQVSANSDFRIEVLATDLRTNAQGVFAAYIDAAISAVGTTAALEADSRPIMDPLFTNGVRFNFANTALVDETGSFRGNTDPNAVDDPTAEQRVFSFVVHAGSTPGTITVNPGPGQASGSDILLFGSDVKIPNDNVAFEGLSIPVVASTLPRASLSPNVSVTEGNTGATNAATLTVSLDGPATQAITVGFETLSGTAVDNPASARDFNALTGTVTFGVGDTSKTFTVPVRGDVNTNEGDEVFHVNLTTLTNTLAQDSHATVTILNDDLTVPAVSISDLSITEGNPTGNPPSTTKNAVITLTMTAPSQQPVTVVFTTVAGTATADNDYNTTTGTATFGVNNATTTTITVPLRVDTTQEGDETFLINLSGVQNATLADNQATVTILNDDGVVTPTLSIAPVTVTEGDTGSANAVFTVTLSSAASQDVSVIASTSNGSATAPGDYTTTSQTINFATGETSKTFTVPIIGDTNIEASESFTVTLSGATGATVSSTNGSALGTITDNDQPTLTMPATLSVVETNGATNALITVTLSAGALQPVTANFATTAGTATGTPGAGADYTTTTGTISFAIGQTSRVITVPIIGDTANEPNETFTVSLSGVTGATPPANSTTVTITDDDLPGLSITPPTLSIPEGNSGNANAVFTVTLAGGTQQDVQVVVSTSNGTATAGQDYTTLNQTLTFTSAGPASQPVTVPVIGDATIEDNETFTVTLSGATGGTAIVNGSSVATITNDDLPSVSISPPTLIVPEGQSGTSNALLTITLSASSPQQVVVPFTVNGQTATGGSAPGTGIDFISTPGSATFAPTETSKVISIQIVGDAINETDELFNVNLGTPTNATIATGAGQASVTIDNDDPPAISIGNVTVSENGANAIFSVTLSTPWTQEVQVQFATSNGSATAGADYTATTGTVTFAANTNTPQLITVPILQDTLSEGNETFTVTLSNPTGSATFADNSGLGTITDDDLPLITINSPSVTEGNTGTVPAVFTVTLSTSPTQTVTVQFATAGVTATAGTDFTANSGAVTFTAGGGTTQTITVNVTGDTQVEPNETFSLTLSSPTNAVISGTGIGTGTITNDDLPTITVSSVAVTEGNSGTVNAVVTISLSGASSQQVTAPFSTSDVTATAGTDYTAASGVLTFAAGETSKLVTVSVIGDATPEATETFNVNVTNPVGAIAPTAPGVVTITTDDALSTIAGKVFIDVNNSGAHETGERPIPGVTIQLADAAGTTILKTTTTDAQGNYSFLDLQPGTYTIIETQPATMMDGTETVGSQGGTSTTNDRIVATLGLSANGTGNNFAERGMRSEFVSKRMFLSSNASTTTTLQALNLREGSVWIPFDAGIDGTLTAEATGAAGEGMPQMTIYDSNLRPLASSTGTGTSSRLDYQGQPGQPYFLAVSGANSDVDVDISNAVKQVGSTVTVTGTSADDTFEFMAGSSYTVIINGVNYTFQPSQVNSIVFNGNGGNDTAIVNGSSAAETASLTLGSGTFSGSGYSVNLNGMKNIVVNGNGGNDAATLADSALSDDLAADGDWIGLSNDQGFATSLQDFSHVTATASHGGADTADISAIDFILERTGWQDI